MEFTYTLFDFKNLEVLENIFKSCFGTCPPNNYFKWKYIDNPAGKAIAFVATHNGKLAGFYGVIPEIYTVNNKETIVYQSMDTMTHPDYRRKGLFTKLAKLTYDFIENENGKVNIIGFPGLTSHPGFVKKLNWETLVELKYSFSNRYLHKINRLFNKSSKGTCTSVDIDCKEFQFYLSSRIDCDHIEKRFTVETLRWRFFDSPIMKYEFIQINAEAIAGFLIYNIDDKNRLFINYIDIQNKDEKTRLLRTIITYLYKKHNPKYIYSFQKSNYSKCLSRIGFISTPFNKGPFSYKTPLILFGNNKLDELNFYQLNNWEIQPHLRDY